MSKLLYGILCLTSMGGFLGATEVYQKSNVRIFSKGSDTIYQGAARGCIRSLIFPLKTIECVPQVWEEELKKNRG